jgi:hypothetical protein
MNHRRLVSAGLIAAFLGWSATPARAVELTLDMTQAAHAVAELAQLAQAYRVLMCQYQQLQAVTLAVQHANPTIMNTAPALQSSQMQLPGSAAAAMPGLTAGSSLTSAGQPFFNQSTVYTSQGTDFASTEMQRQQTATANIQGEAQTGMTRIAQRIASLTQLAASIQTQPDVTAVAATNARISAEHLYIANEGNNIANLQLMSNMQQQTNQQRAQQNSRMQTEQWGSATSAQAGWGASQ